MSQDNKKPIRHVTSLDPLSSELVAAPTKELEERIRLLENALHSISRSGTVSNVIIKDRRVASEVAMYSVVYYNPSTGLYENALARVEFSGTTFKSMTTSMAIGIVVKLVGNSADILVDGAWPSAAFKQGSNLLEPGEAYQAGRPYYLSSDSAGRLTFRPPSLAIQVMVSTEDSILMNKVYGSPEGFEKAAKFAMGMRPVGSLRTLGNESRIVGFNGLESNSLTGEWSKIEDNEKFTNTGYMVAEGEAIGVIDSDLWVEMLTGTDGSITINTASSLAQLSDPDVASEKFTEAAFEAADIPFAVLPSNHSDVRSYLVRDSNGTPVQRIKFKYVCNAGSEFDTDKFRSVIFNLPTSFMGWKELYPGGGEGSSSSSGSGSGGAELQEEKFQIQPYFAEASNCDYEDYDHTPNDAALYYATKGDFGFVQNWPAEPLGKAIVLVNGVEMDTAELEELGLASRFLNPKYDIGISIKSLYWPTAYVEATPWGTTYDAIVKKEIDTFNTDAAIVHRAAPVGHSWCWQEALYSYEPLYNKGWVYTNKLSVYSKSNRVLGIGVMAPLKLKDMITGVEPSYTGEPIGGNLLLWSDDSDNILSKVQDVDLGRFSTQILYTNDTKFNVVVKDITFVVRSQNNAQLSNSELGQVFSPDDYALVDLGTGVEGKAVYNIIQRAQVKVLEYNTACVLTIKEGGAIIPPKGVARLKVYRPFDVEQTVSVIFAGRTI